MAFPELDHLIAESRTHLPQLGMVDTVLIGPEPDRHDYPDEVSWFCAGLKNRIIISDLGYQLTPLRGVENSGGFPWRVLAGWNNPDLCAGYLDTLPKNLLEIISLLKIWDLDPASIVYEISHSEHVNSLGFLQAELSLRDSGLVAEINYGNLNSEVLRQGHITNATGIFLQSLKTESPYFGLPAQSVETYVSDRNTGSVKILANNGFVYDHSRSPYASPIVMGGTSVSVVLNFTI